MTTAMFSIVVCFLLVSSTCAQRPGRSVAELLAEAKSNGLRGSSSLGAQWTPLTSAEGQQVVTPRVEEAFLQEVEVALGTRLLDSSRERLADILKALEPTFESLNKNEYGKLGHTAVRYALHRLFVARHGWLMKGLDPAGQHFNSSSPVEVLKGKTSLHVQGIFEKRLGGQGFGLQELAVFASVLETLITTEVHTRLKALYEKFELEADLALEEQEADDVLDLYMSAYILGFDIKKTRRRQLQLYKDEMQLAYPYWKETQRMVREVRVELHGTKPKPYFLDEISAVLVVVGERFGQWQNTECHQMKEKLVKLEADEKGCVPLSSFYERSIKTEGQDWQFSEKLDYLKQNGILDESDPGNPKVMVANYMYSPLNCIATSSYYAVCCIDECESLLGRIEVHFRDATVPPFELAALVAALPSSTLPANRTLPPSQMLRLQRIADKHGGRVPIHGRLFMQWMHMAYPRECAYPHLSGTTNPLTPDAWTIANGGVDTSATVEEMERFAHAPVSSKSTQQGQCGRWVDEEELFVGTHPAHSRQLHVLENEFETWLAASSVALLCVLAAMTVALIQSFKSLKHGLFGCKQHPLVMV